MFAKFPQRVLGERVGVVKKEKRALEAPTLPPSKRQKISIKKE